MPEPQLAAVHTQLGAMDYDAAGLTPEAAPLIAVLLKDLAAAGRARAAAEQGNAGRAGDDAAVHYQVGAGHGGEGRAPCRAAGPGDLCCLPDWLFLRTALALAG